MLGNKEPFRLANFKFHGWMTVVVAFALIILLARFAAVGWQRMLLNSNSMNGDQGAYLQLGLNLREHGVLTDGTRNPLYPMLLATFAVRDWRYFTYAKFLSLAFGLFSILGIFCIGYRLFGLSTALLAAFLLSINMEFVLHSTFALAESLLALCVLAAWFVMICALRNPASALLWAAAGGLAGLAYLAKGTGQLVVGCFVLAALLIHGLRIAQHRAVWGFLVAYGLVALPLWVYNWKTFGSPTFNLAVTHQMWMDSWDENFVSDVSTLPTLWTFWQSHSWQEAWTRAWKGLADMRFFVAKMLWPTRSLGFDRFLLSGWSGVALAVVIGGTLLARRSVGAFLDHHRQAVILTILMSIVFYMLFAWYIAIVPLPIRFMLPLLSLWLLFVSAGLVGIGRWILSARSLPTWSRMATSLGVLALVLLVGRWFVVSGLASGQALWQSPFDADSAFNSDNEQPLLWVRSGHSSGSIGVLVGAGSSSLPLWRHSDRLRFVRLPMDVRTSDDLESFLKAEGVEYVIVDANMVERIDKAAEGLLGVREILGDRVVFDVLPANWALGFAYPDVPCKWCVFRRMADNPPTHVTNFVLGDAIRLAGFGIVADDFRPGGSLAATLYWESLKSVESDYTVFTQVLGPDWQLHGQLDRQPIYGQWPTSRWQPGQKFVDKFVIEVSEGAPSGEYAMLVGLYDLGSGQRMPVMVGGDRVPDDAIVVYRLSIGEGQDGR
jgi:4-amino-4-deoxy-L-arabinose transferase-like glycosyltransferase